MGTQPNDGAASSRSPRSPACSSQQSAVAGAVHSVKEVSVESNACSHERFPLRKESGKAVRVSVSSKRSEGDEEMKQEHEGNEAPMELVMEDDDDETESDEEMELLLLEGAELLPVRSTQRNGDDQEAHGQDAQQRELTARASAVSTAPSTSSFQIELPDDELLLEAAVARAAGFADHSVSKKSIWESIASSTGGARVLDGYAAKARVMWLQRVWLDKQHTVHPALSDHLKHVIEQYREMRERATHKTGQKKRKRRMVFDKVKAAKAVCRRQKRLMNQKPLADVDQQQEQEEKQNQEEEEEEEEKEDPQAIFPSLPVASKRQPPIRPELEENVMRIVLLHASKLQNGKAKIDVWNTIARESRGRYTTGESARARTAWLCKVLKKSDHVEHSRITLTLREMLVEFQQFEPSPHRRSIYKQPVEETEEASDVHEEPVVQTVAPSQNEALLCELLRVRPFHARQGVVAAWDRVVAALHAKTPWGSEVFPTAKACLLQMKRLLFAVRHPNRPSNVQLENHRQVKMVKLVDTLVKMRWPQVEGNLTAKHRQLLEQIHQVLRTQRDESENRLLESTQAAVGQASAVVLASNQGGRVDEAPDHEGGRIDRSSRGQKRKQPPYEPPLSVSTPGKAPRLHLRQNRAVGIEAGSQQAVHSEEMKQLQVQVAMCRAQLTLQSESFESGRREHRQEQRSWMEMLRGEREAHKREMAAVLEVLKGEQQGRKSEFEAMMELFTRATSQRKTHE